MFPLYIFKILSVFSFLFNTGLNDIRREDKVGKYIPLARGKNSGSYFPYKKNADKPVTSCLVVNIHRI